MTKGQKRTVAKAVKMTPDDWAMMLRAATKLYGGAPLSDSTIILSLAKLGAQGVLDPES